MIILLVLGAISFAASLTVLAETAMPAARRRRDAVAIVRRFVGTSRRTNATRRPSPTMAMAEKVGTRMSTRKFRDGLSQRLAAAGYTGRVTSEAFLAFRVGMVAIGVLVGLSLGAAAHLGGRTMLLCAVAGTAGFIGPGIVLSRKARTRRARISAELPDALDLLAVTVEAGLGLYGAMERLVEMTTGPLAEEFSLVLTELRVGDSSERALKRMASRMQSAEVASFVRSLIQGEQLGMSLAQTLRNLADDTRHRRRAQAEETASKTPVKMLVPTALFIFPALFVVLLGPAVLELKKYL